jgi:hypothetical protein
MYTIEYERDGHPSVLSMWFADKQLAIANACELLSAGYPVIKVQGPGFQIGRQGLSAYRRATPARSEPAAERDERQDAEHLHSAE